MILDGPRERSDEMCSPRSCSQSRLDAGGGRPKGLPRCSCREQRGKAGSSMWSTLLRRSATVPSQLSRARPAQPASLRFSPQRSTGALGPSVRHLCAGSEPDEAAKAEVLEFLRAASRPIQGKAKAKTSAGQMALDLTRHASRLEDLDLKGVLRCDGAELKRRGIGCQERKRLLKYTYKYLQGYRHDGREGDKAWKGWLAPYRLPGHPSNELGRKQPYNLDPETYGPGPAGW